MKIRTKINKKTEIESLVLLYFFITVLFSGYLEHYTIWNVLCILCLVVLGLGCNGFKLIAQERKIVISIIAVLGMGILCTVYSIGNMQYYFANLRSVLYSLCVILSLYIIQRRKPGLIMHKLERGWLFWNIWLIINLIVLNQQVNRNFIFIKRAWLEQNPYWKDHCDGLFGMNSTDIIGYFVIIVVILNIYCANKCIKKKWKRNTVFLYTGVISVISLYLFTKNDGVAEFVLLPLAVLYQIIIQYSRKSIYTKLQKFAKYSLLIIVVIALLLTIEPVSGFISEKVFRKAETMLKFRSTTAEIRGSNERIAIAAYGFSNGWGWGLGKGIGYLKWQAQNAFGFDHFGISSIGSFINLTGIWFYLCMCFLYTSVWSAISETCRRIKGKVMNFWLLFANVIMMTIYVFVFTEIRTNISLILILVILYSTKKKADNQKMLNSRLISN